MGNICKCKQYFWTVHNSFFHKLYLGGLLWLPGGWNIRLGILGCSSQFLDSSEMPTHLAVEADNISGWVWGSNPWVCGGPWPRLGSMARAKYITMCLEEMRVPDFSTHDHIQLFFCLMNILIQINVYFWGLKFLDWLVPIFFRQSYSFMKVKKCENFHIL